MRQRILACTKILKVLALLVLLGAASTAFAVPVTLVAHNFRGGGDGGRSTLIWKDCGPIGTGPGGIFVAPCIDPTNPWVVANNVVGSDATWDWNPSTQVLSSHGLFWTHAYIGSNPSGVSIISDKTYDLTIDIANSVTTAASYECIEGNFLPNIGANGCGGWSYGRNDQNDSSVAYSVGGNPYCVVRTLNTAPGGDDQSTGLPRGVTDFDGGSGCDPTNGAFTLWTVVQDNLSTGGTLILSNGICIAPGCAGANWMTFAAVPLPAVGWLLGPALGVIGWYRRRASRA